MMKNTVAQTRVESPLYKEPLKTPALRLDLLKKRWAQIRMLDTQPANEPVEPEKIRL